MKKFSDKQTTVLVGLLDTASIFYIAQVIIVMNQNSDVSCQMELLKCVVPRLVDGSCMKRQPLSSAHGLIQEQGFSSSAPSHSWLRAASDCNAEL